VEPDHEEPASIYVDSRHGTQECDELRVEQVEPIRLMQVGPAAIGMLELPPRVVGLVVIRLKSIGPASMRRGSGSNR
jgi:hypothetical protein